MSRIATSRRRLAATGALAATVAAIVAAPLAGAATPRAAASPTAIPSDQPRAGCATLTDAQGDATDSGNDIKALVMRSTDTALIGYVQLFSLSSSGSGLLDEGNHFSWGFTLNGHKIEADVAQTGPVSGLVRSILGPSNTNASIDGSNHTDLDATSILDKATNTAVISISRAAIEKDTGGSIPDGTYLQGLNASDGSILLVGTPQTDDTVTDPDKTGTVSTAFEVGHSDCFQPAPATVQITGANTASTGTFANLAAKIINSDGSVDANRLIRFTIGNLSTEATTNSQGIASTPLKIALTPGYYSQTVYFAGDSKAGETSSVTQFVVSYRASHMTMSYVDVSNGRKFTISLLDASNTPITGQTITWSVKGTTKANTTTDSAGHSVFTDTSNSREVLASYAGVSGSIAGCTAEFKY